jgi:hypothetical protein
MRGAGSAVLVSLALSCGMAGGAQAQSGDGPTVAWGPLRVAPLVSFATLVDTNVFNESEAPKQDLVVRAMPQLEGELAAGRARLQLGASANISHFRRYRDQSSIDVTTSSRLDVDLLRVTPYVSASLVRTRERPNLEIDIRPQRLAHTVTAGAAVALSSKTAVVLGMFRERLRYADDAVFRDVSLREGLDRTRDGGRVELRHDLTPLTTLAFAVESDRERFTFSPDRNARSLRLLPSIEFSPGGLLNGRAAVGHRRLQPEDPRVPPFTGTAATIEISYVLGDTTQFAVRVNRDVAYSYNALEPYYLLTAADLSVTRFLGDRLRLRASVGRQQLDYRRLGGGAETARREEGLVTGIEVLYVTNRDLSFGVTLDRMERSTGTVLPGYQGLRTGVVVNYGH